MKTELVGLPPIKVSNERFLIVGLVPVVGGFDAFFCDSRPTFESAQKLAVYYSELVSKQKVRFGVVDFLGAAKSGVWKPAGGFRLKGERG